MIPTNATNAAGDDHDEQLPAAMEPTNAAQIDGQPPTDGNDSDVSWDWEFDTESLREAVEGNEVDEAKSAFAELKEELDANPRRVKQTSKEDIIFKWLVKAASVLHPDSNVDRFKAMKAVLTAAGGCNFLKQDNDQYKYSTPLLRALDKDEVSDKTVQVLMQLLEREEMKAVIAPFDDGKDNALILATYFGRPKLLKWLVEKGACHHLMKKKDIFGANVLHIAANRDKRNCIQAISDLCEGDKLLFRSLMEAGDKDNETALLSAILGGNWKTIKAFLKMLAPLVEDPESAWAPKLISRALERAVELDRSDIVDTIENISKELPKLLTTQFVRKALQNVSLGQRIAEALSSKVELKTVKSGRTDSDWLPLMELGREPWVTHITYTEDPDTGTESIDESKNNIHPPLSFWEWFLRWGTQFIEGQYYDNHMVRCNAFRLHGHLLDIDVVFGLTSVKSQALTTPFAQGVLAYFWGKYQTYYYLDIALNAVHLILACVLTSGLRSKRTDTAGFKAVVAATGVIAVKDIADECSQAWYLKSSRFTLHQVMDSLRVLLEIVTLGLLLWAPDGIGIWQGSIETRLCTAIWVFSWWCHFLFDLRGVREIGPLLMPIFKTTGSLSVISFTMLLLVILAASTHAYYVIGVRDEPNPVYAAVVQIYRLGVLGDFDLFEIEGQDPILVPNGNDAWEPQDPVPSASYALVHFLFYLVTIVITVVLMNLFIGVLSNTHDSSLEVAENLFTSTRASLILEYRYSPVYRLFRYYWNPAQRAAKTGEESREVMQAKSTDHTPGAAEAEGKKKKRKKLIKKVTIGVVFIRTNDDAYEQSMRSLVKVRTSGLLEKIELLEKQVLDRAAPAAEVKESEEESKEESEGESI